MHIDATLAAPTRETLLRALEKRATMMQDAQGQGHMAGDRGQP